MLTATDYNTGKPFYFSETQIKRISVKDGKLVITLKNPDKVFVCLSDITTADDDTYFDELMKTFRR